MKAFYLKHWQKLHLIGVLAFGKMAMAQGSFYIPKPPTSLTSFNEVLGKAVNFSAGFVGIIAVLYLILSGFNYIMAGGNAKKVAAATAGIRNAITGIVIVIIAVLLVNYVMYNFLAVNIASTTDALPT